MADKKNDDYVVRVSDDFQGEKDPFVAAPNSRNVSQRQSSPQVGLGTSVSRIDNSPGASVLAYCLSSISMTVVNKYVVSGSSWNLNFLYLGIQVSDHHHYLSHKA